MEFENRMNMLLKYYSTDTSYNNNLQDINVNDSIVDSKYNSIIDTKNNNIVDSNDLIYKEHILNTPQIELNIKTIENKTKKYQSKPCKNLDKLFSNKKFKKKI